jgi:hypothetical protein
MYKQSRNNEDKIWCGKDKDNNDIWKTEEELDQAAAKLQKWQRNKFAQELGFDTDTNDPLEIEEIDLRYEEMLKELTLWNRYQDRKLNEIMKKHHGLTNND